MSAYYKWEQQLFHQNVGEGPGLQAEVTCKLVRFCQTVLANEQVEGGHAGVRAKARCSKRSLSSGFSASRSMPMSCWIALISSPAGPTGSLPCSATGSAERRLRNSTSRLEAPEKVITVFTTRPDTLFGATFMSIAPENPLAISLSTGHAAGEEVKAFIERMRRQDKIKRLPMTLKKRASSQAATA